MRLAILLSVLILILIINLPGLLSKKEKRDTVAFLGLWALATIYIILVFTHSDFPNVVGTFKLVLDRLITIIKA